MNVILCGDVENLGTVGQKVTVADGYARNYLIPRKLAVPVDAASAKQIEHELRIIRKREERRRAELTALARQIEGLTLEFEMRAGEHDKLFGSVTTAMIAEKLAEAGFEVSRKTIELAEPIKALGIYTVTVRLAGGIAANVKVWVKGLEGELTTETEPEEVGTADEDDDEEDDEE